MSHQIQDSTKYNNIQPVDETLLICSTQSYIRGMYFVIYAIIYSFNMSPSPFFSAELMYVDGVFSSYICMHFPKGRLLNYDNLKQYQENLLSCCTYM